MNIGNCHALNYSSACVADLTKLAETYAAASMPYSSLGVRSLLKTMTAAQRFVLPDGGRLLEDNLRGIKGRRLRLPFPVVTLEYFVDQTGQAPGEQCSRRIAIAQESTYAELGALMTSMNRSVRWPRKDGDERLIIVSAVSFYDLANEWRVQACAIIIGESWEAQDNSQPIPSFFPRKTPLTGGEAKMGVLPIALLPEVSDIIIEEMGYDAAFQAMMHDVNDEVTAVLEFCEALTCVNVTPTKIQSVSPTVNARRAASGKLPLADAWCLTLDVPLELKVGRATGVGAHRSPRTHLRRGHIRRLPDKNVWVNSTVVGSGDVKIEKHYHLSATRLTAP